MSKLLGFALGGLLLASALPASAQDPVVERMRVFHEQCQKGDRAACVRFGVLLGEHQALYKELHRTHADFFWWDH